MNKGYNVGSRYQHSAVSSPQHRVLGREGSSGFFNHDPPTPQRRKESTASRVDSPLSFYPSPPPFPHLHDTNDKYQQQKFSSFKPYESPGYTQTPTNPVKFVSKRDAPKRLPKLENLGGGLKITTGTSNIEYIAEKSSVDAMPLFQIHKIELTNYAKLPNLSNAPAPSNTAPANTVSTPTNLNGMRKIRSESKRKVHEFQQQLKVMETTIISEETKQAQEIKQVQDNIQMLASIHSQHNAKNKSNTNFPQAAHRADTIQSIQDITQIQDSIHQTQNLLLGIKPDPPNPHRRSISPVPSETELKVKEEIKLDKFPAKNPAVVLGSYIPRLVFRRFANSNRGEITETFFDNFWGVVVFADISGFTAVTKRLLKLGTEGLEFLKNKLSDYFDGLVSLIHDMGGDVVSFSGDAVVAVWWSDEATSSQWKTKNAERAHLAHRASHCALQIQKTLSNRRYQIGTDDELVLNLRVSVSASHLCGVHVGGVKDRWLFTVYGSAISEIADAMTQCVIGDVMVAHSVWKLIKGYSVGVAGANNFVNLQETDESQPHNIPAITYAPEMAEWMKLYISPVILSRLTAGQEDFVGEFRTVTVLFICIHSINFQTTRDPNPSLANAFPKRKLQQAVRPNFAEAIPEDAEAPPVDNAGDTHEIMSESDEATAQEQARARARKDSSGLTRSDVERYITAVTPPRSTSQKAPPNRLFVSYSDGLDAYVDSAGERVRTTLASSARNSTDISERLHFAVTTIQTELLPLEGDINKLVADDKGLIVVAVFGLPPMSHEDDPLRGVLAAISIRDQLTALNMECSIGVSTGKVFCGNYGSKGHNRREYTVIGDSVNTAARLMTKADKNILCDTFTYKFSSNKVWFENLDPVILKGYDQPVPVFQPDRIRVSSTKNENPHHQFYGRSEELKMLIKCATVTARSLNVEPTTNKKKKKTAANEVKKECVKLIIVEGEQGVGKSMLVDMMLQSFRGKNITLVESNTDPYKNNGPLHGIWPIFMQCLGLSQDLLSNRLRVLAVVKDNQNYVRLLPLLNKYLPLDFPSNPLCNELSDNAKLESLIYITTQMLKIISRDKPMIMVFENGQWLDRQSWVVFTEILKSCSHVLVVVAMRPISENIEALTILKANLVRIALNPLDKDTTLHIILQHLKAKSLPQKLCDIIYDRAQGNTLMCVEVAHFMLSSGVITIGEHGDVSIRNEAEIENFEIPSSLESMITARIDKLPPGPLLTLKVAAIIGKSCSFKLLESIYPIAGAKQELMENLLTLRKLNILALDDSAISFPDQVMISVHGRVAYAFKDCLYMDVAYNLMLFAQKRQLHEQIALWYENALTKLARFNHSQLFSFLIRHWEASGNKEKARYYTRRAVVVERWATLRKIIFSHQVVNRGFGRSTSLYDITAAK